MNNMEVGAWIVPVRTERMGGGQPMLVYYIAAFHEAEKAKEAVAEAIKVLEGDVVGDPSPVSIETAKQLGVRPGEVRML